MAAGGEGAGVEGLLARHGLELLGVAHTAFAFSPPDAPHLAVKVGLDPDDGWPAWAVWARQNPSPHLPRVASLDWIVTGGRRRLFVAAVERLYPSLVGRRWIKACPGGKRDPLALAAHVAPSHPSVAALLRAAAAAFPAGRWDMGGPNWLERQDGTLVLNDPLSRA